MKKIVLILLLSIAIFSQATAKTPTSDFAEQYNKWKSDSKFSGLTHEMDIQGNVNPAGNISITIFDSSNDENKGIPFDIAGGDVSLPAGRQIGEFTLFSNSPHVKLTVNASPLVSGSEELTYTLKFSYKFASYGDDGKLDGEMTAGEFSVDSDNKETIHEINAGSEHQQININGGANGGINIYISEDDANAAAPGFYESTVTISMEVIE